MRDHPTAIALHNYHREAGRTGLVVLLFSGEIVEPRNNYGLGTKNDYISLLDGVLAPTLVEGHEIFPNLLGSSGRSLVGCPEKKGVRSVEFHEGIAVAGAVGYRPLIDNGAGLVRRSREG